MKSSGNSLSCTVNLPTRIPIWLKKQYHHHINTDRETLPYLRKFLLNKRDLLLRLLENSDILEHKTFSELLMTVFHLEKELEIRKKISQLPEEDVGHFKKDIERVYTMLIHQWLDYMQHLKKEIPLSIFSGNKN